MTSQDSWNDTSAASIHVDPPENRRPLPIAECSAPSPDLAPEQVPFEHCATIQAGLNHWIHVRLRTDSAHLSNFFISQWGDGLCNTETDATIYALVKCPEHYGVSPEFSERRTWFRHLHEVWQFGTEYYGNIKVSVRGLSTALAKVDELFLHGCALQLGTLGFVLSGTSGSGKSTLTAALRALEVSPLKVVNDDWGAVSLSREEMYYTGERRLHMKYRSVALLCSGFCPDPNRYATENYAYGSEDVHARLLIPRADVFGEEGIGDVGPLSTYIVLFRDTTQPFSIRPMHRDDLMRIEEGEFSAFYRRHEFFLDGSLFLTSPGDMIRHRSKLERLTEEVPAWVINNVGPPSVTAREIIDTILARI